MQEWALEKMIFSYISSLLSPSQRQLTTDWSEACVLPQATEYDPPDIKA